jgi:hypothetical protein
MRPYAWHLIDPTTRELVCVFDGACTVEAIQTAMVLDPQRRYVLQYSPRSRAA